MQNSKDRRERAIELMLRFAERTGLTSARAEQRYLWTDAFAVCNFTGLARTTGEERYRNLALELVERVHRTLGRHRSDDSRSGWISGLGAEQARAHPTRGGLRIGKDLPERRPRDAFDERLEWNRDGQYFHYLTQWMHALDRMTQETGKPVFNAWARELAETAFRAFTYTPAGSTSQRMYWKMSIDLSRPLVSSMGQHDPLDGYVTYLELGATAAAAREPPSPHLDAEIAAFAAMLKDGHLATADPLGIGGLLIDAFRLQRLALNRRVSVDALLPAILEAALDGLEQYTHAGELGQPASERLAFRELGLAIGLQGASLMWQAAEQHQGAPSAGTRVHSLLSELRRYVPVGAEIEAFWLEQTREDSASWVEHRNINEVMLATSLVPEGFLGEIGGSAGLP